ncbi:tetratricopeptide repeat protein [Pseudomonas sp. EA_65y_Pfl2_P74]|uniref:tetratricopeptide repeat protein n=1 Tax=Pseudomonas sp. EA_65y_Pfl2_P74 TaxID=3088694 RepID=UPI0030DA29AB
MKALMKLAHKIFIFCSRAFLLNRLPQARDINKVSSGQTQTSGERSFNVQAGRDVNLTVDMSSISEDIRDLLSKAAVPNDAESQHILRLIEDGRVKEAEALVDSVFNDTSNDYANKARNAGNLYAKINRDKAIYCYTQSTSIQNNDYDTLNILALLLLEKGSQDEALAIFDEILANSNKNEVNEKVHGNLGVLYKNNGKTSEALSHLFKAVELATASQNTLGSCKHLNNIGSCYNNIENTQNAEKYLSEALNLSKIAVENSTSTLEKQAIKSVKSNILTNLSITAQRQYKDTNDTNYLALAETHLLAAIEIDETLNNSIGLGRHYGNLANVLRLKGDLANSRKYIEKSIIAFQNNHSLKDELTSRMNLGRAFAVEGNLQEAIKNFKESKEQNSAELYPKLYALTLMNMAYTHLKLNSVQEAKDCATEALEVMKKLNLTSYITMLEYDFKIR